MKKLYTLLFIGLISLSFGQTFTGTYDFASVTTTSGVTDPTPVPTATGMTFSSFSATNPGTPTTFNGSSGAGRFAFPNQPLGATTGDNVYANYTGALDTNIYYEVTITPNAGTVYDLTGITFRMQRSGTGVRTYAVRSSVDNYVSNLTASINPANTNLEIVTGNIFFYNTDATGGQNGSTITLTGAEFTGLTGAVTFRFYGWNSEAATGNFSIDDVAISGNVTTLSSTSFDSINGLKMYPNPAKNNLFIETALNSNINVTIVDMLGKEVLNTKAVNNLVNVANLQTGVYIVNITEDGKTATRKLVIE